jgi:hypothetical protein
MAIRVNVTAIRNCPPGEVRAVMSEVIQVACQGPDCTPVGDLLQIQEHNGWVWFTTSVWGVSAGDLNRGLCQLARPALQFATSDGDRWYLTVHGGPHGQVHFLHEFGYHSHAPDPAEDAERQAQIEHREEPPAVDPRLAFLEDDPAPEPARERIPFDLIADGVKEMGGSIPDEFRASVAHLPYSDAVNRYREWHAEQVCKALADAGIEHDPAAVRSVLLWEHQGDGGDLGNLPWFLSALGLGGEWDEYVRQAETPPAPEPEPELQSEQVDQAPSKLPSDKTDHFGPVLAILEPLGLSPVAGGPYLLPPGDLTLIRFFVEALSIHNTAGTVLAVALPRAFDRFGLPEPKAGGMGKLEYTADGFRVGLSNHLWFNRDDLTNQFSPGLVQLLDHLPDGCVLDLSFALADRPALRQRYRGPVSARQWRITETYPPLSREALAGAFDLARYAAGEPEKHELRSVAEAEAVVRLAKRDPNLWDMKILRDGRTVWCTSDIVGHLPKVIFRHRYSRNWDVAAHDREAAKAYEYRVEMQRQMRRAGAQAARRRAAPHDDEVLLEGRLGPYWRSDMTQLSELEQETRKRIDAALAGLGFEHLGDLVAKKKRDIVVRSHVSRDRLSYGLFMAKRTLYLGYEFFSRFRDGSSLTTTVSGAVDSKPDLKVYFKVHAGLDPVALYEKHQIGINRFRARKGTVPVPLEPTLAGVAREYDVALARREGVAQHFRIVAPPPGEAPAEIRAAWVGCVLPLFASSDDSRVGKKPKGVLSRRPESFSQGFTVQVVDAIRELEHHNSGAAQWWRENIPDIIRPGQLFLFAREACELVDEA